jgi:hypothetical protein
MAKKNCLGGANGGRCPVKKPAGAPEQHVISKDPVYPRLTKATPTSKRANHWVLRVYGWTGQQSSSGFCDLTPATLGVFASLDRF